MSAKCFIQLGILFDFHEMAANILRKRFVSELYKSLIVLNNRMIIWRICLNGICVKRRFFWGGMLSRLQRDTHAFARPMRLCRIQPGLFFVACRRLRDGVCGQGTHSRHALRMAVAIAAIKNEKNIMTKYPMGVYEAVSAEAGLITEERA